MPNEPEIKTFMEIFKHTAGNINILLADDDEDDRLFFSTALSEMVFDCNLAFAHDGVELLDTLNNISELPDIVFLDMNMPKKSGLEALQEIRANRKFDTICIVIYSTLDSEEQVDKLLAEGANIYFNKPAELDKIKDMIRQVIRIYRYYPDLGSKEEAFYLSM
jgi:CheY-like chemotaxis protein